MSILVEHNAANINDYIVSCDKIPHVLINVDGTMAAPYFSMEVSNTYLTPLNEGDIINVTVNSKLVFNGFISGAEILYTSRTTRITVSSTLLYLQNKRIDEASLDVYSADASKYFIEDGLVVPNIGNVQLLWVLQCMFDAAGLTVNTSGVEDINVGTFRDSYGEYTYKTQHVMLDINALYLINQGYASAPSETVKDWESIEAKPTFFDFVIDTCGYFGWVIVLDGTYKLLPLGSRTTVSIADDDKFGFSQTRELADATTAGYSALYAERASYLSVLKETIAQEDTTTHVPAEVDGTASRKKLSWMNNYFFMVRDIREGAATGSLYSTSGAVQYTPNGLRNTLSPAVIAATSDRIITETTTDFNTSVLEVYEHHFDLENRTTTLKEVTFI